MTSRATDAPLRRQVARHYDALRRRLVWRAALGAAAASAAIIGVAVALGVVHPTGETLAWARTIAALACVVVALGFAVAGFLRSRPGFDAYLQRIEDRFPAVTSWLRNALDFERRLPAHTSEELARALSAETARRLADVPLHELRPPLRARRPVATLALAALAILSLAALFPARTQRSWRTLLAPRTAAPAVRLEVEPGSVAITPGVALAVRAHVWGTAARPRLLRDGAGAAEGGSGGSAAADEGRGSGGERLWRFDLAQLTRALDYRVRVAGVESPRYHVALAGTPQPVSFEIELRPPAYARLPVQRGAATRGDLSALRGSRARIEVLFDRDLASLEAALPGAAPRPWIRVNPRRWRGEIAILAPGTYELRARTRLAAGEGGGASSNVYRIEPLADAPPVLTVREPVGDLDLPEGQQIAYDVLGQDDLGLTELRLQTRKDPDAPWTNVPLARFAGEPREAAVARRWDAASLGLLPGQSASFRFQLFDDNAVDGRGVATSPTYELRFPSVAELVQSLDQRQDSVQSALERVADQSRELQKSLDQIARPSPSPPNTNTQSYVRQEEVKSALDRQQDLSRRIDEAAQRLRESLDQAAERRVFDDQLTNKLRELAELMSQIQSKEFKDAVRRLQQALETMQPQLQQQGLQDWRRQNQQLLENLQRTLELLKRLRQEERLQALAQRAQELKDRQDRRNESVPERAPADSAARARARQAAEEQKRAAAESEQLAKDARQLAQEMGEPQAQAPLGQAAEELDQQASPAQQEAAQALRQGQPPQARQAGQRASQSLQRAARQLSELASAMQKERQEVDLAAVRRSAEDLVSLQRASEETLEPATPQAERADRQQDLSEGTARVADSLARLSEKTPFISPKLSEALGRAMAGLQKSSRQFGQSNRAGGESAGRDASSALVEAVLELRQTESSMCRNPGQGKPGGNIPNRMAQLGRSQMSLNDRTRSLAQRLSEQMRLSAGDQDEMRRLAEEQARLQRELEQIAQEDQQRHQLLGRLDQTADEMKEVEEELRGGHAGDEVEQKQEHILSRLLDAQRSVNRQDFDPQRESRPGQDLARSSPPPIPDAMLRETDRLRLDLLKAQADRYPAQYRAFIEAYLRALDRAGAPRDSQ
ncbi:MAG TPA: hypothetical protein VMS88_01985 [Terriglobales bacterium]|nr:hypothetical protein [Terriglobales bacterium]